MAKWLLTVIVLGGTAEVVRFIQLTIYKIKLINNFLSAIIIGSFTTCCPGNSPEAASLGCK
jgi:hypothetical protein